MRLAGEFLKVFLEDFRNFGEIMVQYHALLCKNYALGNSAKMVVFEHGGTIFQAGEI